MPTRRSTSMHTPLSFSSSWLGSSPSRKSPSRKGIRSPANNLARSTTLDKESPTRQMIVEFRDMLVKNDEEFHGRLDRAAAENAQVYHEQIAKAALEHERVRKGAELERKRLILELELEQQKREEAQRLEVERIQREKAKQEELARQRLLKVKQQEAEDAQRAAEAQRKIQEAEAKVQAQKDQVEAARQQKIQKDEADRKAREDAAKAATAATAAAAAAKVAQDARAQAAAQPVQRPTNTFAPAQSAAQPSAAAPPAPGSAEFENIHTRYLELHQRMKAFWKPFKQSCAEITNPLKGPVGDLRRDMRKATGQVTVKREDSKVVITKLREILRRARNVGGPTVDIRPFIISHPIPPLSNEAEAQYPAILLYAFICFEKFVIKQFEQEAAGEEGRIILELGAIAASLFVDKEFMWNGVPLIDLLLAKYHRACPILFGINGNMDTPEGQARLGYTGDNASFYAQRMTGLSCGFAAMSLRIVPAPAIPSSAYWRSVSAISNVPSEHLYLGHFFALKGLLRDSAKKVTNIYGVPGMALLRRATVTVPNRAPKRASEAASLVRVLPDIWKGQGFALR